jgi:hypothetical protein
MLSRRAKFISPRRPKRGTFDLSQRMIKSQPLAIVIRVPNVIVTRLELEAALSCQVARYEPSGASSYAQVDIPETSDQWTAAIKRMQTLSASIEKLVSEGAIGRPSLDIAFRFPSHFLSTSGSIPASLAEAAGRAGMDIGISVYRTEEANE